MVPLVTEKIVLAMGLLLVIILDRASTGLVTAVWTITITVTLALHAEAGAALAPLPVWCSTATSPRGATVVIASVIWTISVTIVTLCTHHRALLALS